MKIFAVSYPIPTKYAKRIYEGKSVFVSKRCLCKVSKGDKLIIYESHGAKAYTGWADIISTSKQKTYSIIKNYGKNLMISGQELREYAQGKPEMGVIEFENLEIFKNPVKPKRFVTLAGKYIYEDEFEMIKRNKD